MAAGEKGQVISSEMEPEKRETWNGQRFEKKTGTYSEGLAGSKKKLKKTTRLQRTGHRGRGD